jgi:cysteine synthase B
MLFQRWQKATLRFTFHVLRASAVPTAPPQTAPPTPAADAPDRLTDRIGDTPLLRLCSVASHLPERVRVYGKAEHLNPGGSVKDRPARAMVRAGRKSGAFAEGQTLVDATSGNTGIAYALLGAAMDFPVRLFVPENATPERLATLRAYGAEVVLTDPMDGTDGARRRARALADAEPERFFYPDQYNNLANAQAHYDTTAPELIAQTDGRLTDFVAGLGTTGTFVGVARRLCEERPAARCHALQPDGPLHALEGLKHLPTAETPGIYEADLADMHRTCTTEAAHAMTRRLAREEGLLVGASAGANVATALTVAEERAEQGEPACVVTVLCDTGTRYLNENFWVDG